MDEITVEDGEQFFTKTAQLSEQSLRPVTPQKNRQDRSLSSTTHTARHCVTQTADSEAERTPSKPGQGFTPLKNKFGRITLNKSSPVPLASPTRQSSTSQAKVRPIIIVSDDEDDTDTSSASSDSLGDLRNAWSRQTSLTSVGSGGSASAAGSPSRKRQQPANEANPDSPGKIRKITLDKGKDKGSVPPSPNGPNRRLPLSTKTRQTVTSLKVEGGRSPQRQFTRSTSTSTESTSSTDPFLDEESSGMDVDVSEQVVSTVSSGPSTGKKQITGIIRSNTSSTVVKGSGSASSSRTASGPSRQDAITISDDEMDLDMPAAFISSKASILSPKAPAGAASSFSASSAPATSLTNNRRVPPPTPVFAAKPAASTSSAPGPSIVQSASSASASASGEPFVQQLFKSLHLPVHIIAHNEKVQAIFDDPEKPVPWGTQVALAAGVTKKEWTWEAVMQKIEHFRGKKDGEVMHTVRGIMGKEVVNVCDDGIGKELDREQKAIEENIGRGLGLFGDFEGEENWFGGQVQQIATLVKNGVGFKLVLEPLEMRRSSRFTRILGSRRVLQIKIDSNLLMDGGSSKAKNGQKSDREKVLEFLSHKFVLNGRVFVVTPPKDDAVYAIEINEDYERPMHKGRERMFGDSYRISLADFLEHHNPLELNSSQPISKYFARWALQMSTTIPVLEFLESHIYFIRDIVVDGVDGKPESHQILTDGCGLINKAALQEIQRRIGYEDFPIAVQARVAGSKGLFILHPDDEDPTPKIWIRDSQRKIKYPTLTGPSWHTRAHRIFDLVSVSHPASSSVFLSKQSILNMWHNKVPVQVFLYLMEQGLIETLRPLGEWRGKWAMLQLWDTISKIGRVSGTRLARLVPSASRALGFSGREWARDEVGIADEEASGSASMTAVDNGSELVGESNDENLSYGSSLGYTGRDSISGAPVSQHEYALEKIQAGFNPIYDMDLRDTVRFIEKNTVKNYMDKLRIPLPDGTAVEAFAIPDPLGVLKEGQIYYKPSNPIKNTVTGLRIEVLEGEVLIGRYPIRLSSDIQKVTAVDIPALKRWVDVVIVPTVPVTDVPRLREVSFMNMLSGGDMDGGNSPLGLITWRHLLICVIDTVFLIWHQDVTVPFQRTSLILTPADLENDFKRQVERVLQFTSRLADLPIEERQRAFQQTYLAGMAHVDVGLYSAFHDAAVWVHGYDSQAAIRLAYKFNYVLDGPKTGLQLREEVYVKDMQRFFREKPSSDWTPQERLDKHPDDTKKGKFIIDLLAKAGEDLGDRYLHEFDVNNGLLTEHIANKTTRPDQDLKKPWKDAQDLVQNYSSDNLPEAERDIIRAALKTELDLVREHVQKSYDAFRRGAASSSSSNNDYDRSTKKRSGKAPRRDYMRFAKQEYAKPISGISLLSEKVERIKASYAYHKSEKFGYCVAFKQLCAIKADASAQGSAPSTRMFDVTRSTNVFTPVSYSRFPVARTYSAAATAVQQTESTSPDDQQTSPAKQFSSLKGAVSDDLVTALVARPFNLTAMTPVQEEVLSLLPELADPYDPSKKTTRDLLVRAKTGTGKTVAFLLPAIEARLRCIEEAGEKAVRDSGLPDDKNLRRRAELKYARETVGALIISPTRELATQIANEALRLTSRLGSPVEVRLFTGGTNKRPQMKGWMTGRRDIVVATTGRLRDLMTSEPDVKRGIATAQQLILDEADTLLDMGFREDIEAIQQQIPPSPERQTFLFSATVSPQIRSVAQSVLDQDFKYINCVKTEDSPVHAHIPQYHTVVPSASQQIPHVIRLIAHDQFVNAGKSKIILFCPTTRSTQLFATILRRVARRLLPVRETNILEIHSRKTQEGRDATSREFRSDKSGASILVTSDVSARGVDYPNVSRVLQVGCPASTDQYIHRVGRTGRGGTSVAGRADLVLLPWEIGFVTWGLSNIPTKPVTTTDLEQQLTDAAKQFDEDPESVAQNNHSSYRHPYSPLLPQINDIRDRMIELIDPEAAKQAMVASLGYYLGRSGDLRISKDSVVEGCKTWSVEALGLETPPYLSEEFLKKLGVTGEGSRSKSRSFDRRSDFGSQRRSGFDSQRRSDKFSSPRRDDSSYRRSDNFDSRRGSDDFGSRRSFGDSRRSDSRRSDDFGSRRRSDFGDDGDRRRSDSRSSPHWMKRGGVNH
ncbi:hypothetical protein D9758_004049 [Tetrapyrgos nigripes]|uniref:ATP-dependent RNA helicase n=1 Tax=Tetrapyrgos nigripes TaxID=182062 RepID=A0A8H5GLE2_9AGAR|nr:hypothetical protein D9758_004049 [Tetrapyrgos nigripes]